MKPQEGNIVGHFSWEKEEENNNREMKNHSMLASDTNNFQHHHDSIKSTHSYHAERCL